MKKRILSFFLASIMVISMLPFTAFADEAVIPEPQSELDPVLKGAIYLPVTIRDFYNDGMLFEYNSSSSFNSNLWSIWNENRNNHVTLDNGAQFEEQGIRSAVANRYYGDLSVRAKNTAITYNGDGSVTLTSTGNDPSVRLSFLGTHAYAYLAVVYKDSNCEGQGQAFTIFEGADADGNYVKNQEGSSIVSGEWKIAYYPICKHKDVVNKPVNGVRFDYANGANSSITIAGMFMLNRPGGYAFGESVAKSTDFFIEAYEYDDTFKRLYIPIDASGTGAGIFNWSFSPAGEENANRLVFRYRTTGSGITARWHSAAGHDAKVSLIGDGMWRWGIIKSDTPHTANNFTLKFIGSGTVDLAEVYVLTDAQMGSSFTINQLHSGNVYFETDSTNTMTTVATPYYDSALSYSNVQKPLATTPVSKDGYYVNYTASKEGGEAHIMLDIADYASLDVGSGKNLRYVQLRYRAEDFAGKQAKLVVRSVTGGKTNESVKSFTVDDDAKWHTAAIDLGTVFDSYAANKNESVYLSQIIIILPVAGASISVDCVRFFDNVLAAEYYDDNYSEDYKEANTNSFFSMLLMTPDLSGSGGGKGDFIFNYAFEGVAKDIQSKLPGYAQGSGVLSWAGTNFIDYTNYTTSLKDYEQWEAGYWRQGLIESEIGPNGKPVYKQYVVETIARALSLALTVPFENADGSRNYVSIGGTPYDIETLKQMTGMSDGDIAAHFGDIVNSDNLFDIADVLRHNIHLNGTTAKTHYYDLGDYNTTKNSPPAKLADINDCMDAAYYLLNNIWSDGYGFDTHEYSNIALIKNTDESVGDSETYVFGSSFAHTVYDKDRGLIYNTQWDIEPWMVAEGKTPYTEIRFLTEDLGGFGPTASSYYLTLGNILSPLNAYYRRSDKTTTSSLWDKDYNATNDASSALINGTMYGPQNYGYTVEGKGTFTYKEGLYFTFSGDDDVYLFINKKLVLDMGGAHERADLKIDIDKYNATLPEDDKMIIGKEYEFAFFQAERHGFGANFAIYTNIPIENPNIGVEKTASQNGEKLEEGAKINPEQYVVYDLALENKADNDERLVNIVFNDEDIGVYFAKDKITFNQHTNFDDIVVEVNYFADEESTVLSQKLYTASDIGEAELKQILQGDVLLENSSMATTSDYSKVRGLRYRESIKIHGLKYKLTEDNIGAGSFQNIVVVNTDSIDIMGFAESLVKDDDFVVIVSNDKIYVWADNARTFNVYELFKYANAYEKIGENSYDKFENGTVDGVAYAASVTAVEFDNTLLSVSYTDANITSQTITVTVPKTGIYTFDYTITTSITKSGATEPEKASYKYSVMVCAYDVQDTAFVLDYGLPVKLATTADSTGKVGQYLNIKGDVLSLSNNPASTACSVNGVCDANGKISADAQNGAYGKMVLSQDNVLTYTPNKFIEGEDDMYVKVGVSEKTSDYTITKGIEMWKKISFLPASVMYYEESIGSINVPTGSYYTASNGGLNLNQSADQNLHYGYDSAYNGNVSLKGDNATPSQFWISWFEKQYIVPGTGGFDGLGNTYNFSNDSYLKLDVAYKNGGSDYANAFEKSGDKKNLGINFTFKGTGFELISFTNLYSATIVFEVYNTNNELIDGKYVFTKYTNGELQQIPILDWKTNTYGTYKVYVYAIPATSEASTAKNFFLDGVRIFDPIAGDANAALRQNNYITNENGASFEDIRDIVLNDKAVITTVTTDNAGAVTTTFGTGSTLVEYVGGGPNALFPTTISKANSHLSYEKVGPNNEIYLEKGSAITFLLKETGNDANRTFQIEAKQLGAKGTLFSYVVNSASDTLNTANAIVNSYTAMYYNVNVSDCPTTTIGGETYYIVTVGTTVDEKNFKDYPDGTISITTLKLKGYELYSNVQDALVVNTTSSDKTNSALSDIGTAIAENTYDLSGYAAAYNVDLFVKTVTASSSATAGGKIRFNIVASKTAENVLVKDMNGEYIENTIVSVKTFGEYKMFTISIDAPETAGIYDYAVAVQDSTNRLSEEMRVAAIKVN